MNIIIGNNQIQILQPGNYLVEYIVDFLAEGNNALTLALQNIGTATEIPNTAYTGRTDGVGLLRGEVNG